MAPALLGAACCIVQLLLLLPAPHRSELLPSVRMETSLLPSLIALLDTMDDDVSVASNANGTDSDDEFDAQLYMMHLGPPAHVLPMPAWWWRYEMGQHYQGEGSASPDSVFSDSWEPTTDANGSPTSGNKIEEPPQDRIPIHSTWPPPERDPATGNIIPRECNNLWQESQVPWDMPSTSSGNQHPLQTEERGCIYGAIGQPVPRQHNVEEVSPNFSQQLQIDLIRQLISQLLWSEIPDATGSSPNAMSASRESYEDEAAPSRASKPFTWDPDQDS